MTILKVNIPPQISLEEEEELEKNDATLVLISAILLSILLGVPSEVIYDGILFA